MKTAFSTLGCPDWSFGDIYATAKDLGFDGIEIRGIGNEMNACVIPEFSDAKIEQTKRKFEGDLKISCLSSGACLGTESDSCVKEAQDYLVLADKLSVPFVRVLISASAQPEDADTELALQRYRALCDFALARDIKAQALIETSGCLADSAKMRAFLDKADRPNAGALWDIHHPFRYFGETAEVTAKNLGAYIKYMHVKDSYMENGALKYRMMGYGDVPVYDALKAAKTEGFDGYVSLEWLKRWMPDLQDGGVVFSHYLGYIKHLFEMI